MSGSILRIEETVRKPGTTATASIEAIRDARRLQALIDGYGLSAENRELLPQRMVDRSLATKGLLAASALSGA